MNSDHLGQIKKRGLGLIYRHFGGPFPFLILLNFIWLGSPSELNQNLIDIYGIDGH